MSRLYSVTIDAGSITNANGDYELLELDAAAGKPIEICGWDLGQTSELQEAQEEQLRITIIRGHTTDGTGGSSFTPQPIEASGAAAGFTADILRTGIASSGSPVTIWGFPLPVRAGHQYGPVPEGYGFATSEANLLVVRLATAVADDLTFQGAFLIREYG